MKQNENNTDRLIRAIVGVVLIGIGWLYLGNNTLGLVFDVLGLVALFTAATGFCLLYKLFGDFSTRK